MITHAFEIPESSADIQMMTVWAKALEGFEVEPAHKRAALKWFRSYALSEIRKQEAEIELQKIEGQRP